MKIEYIRDTCTGCGACMAICPKHSISMQPDSGGYIYPEIDHDTCVECGLCDKVCPELLPVEKRQPISVKAAVAVPAISESSSGGVATLIAAEVIEAGGAVYGCLQADKCKIEHRRVSTLPELDALKGSKYVHSDTGDTFAECRCDLQNGKEVVYIGTPCQISGLRKYLGKDYPNLCTIDLICHGVPAQRLLSDEIDLLRRRHSLPQEPRIRFRDKTSGKVKFGLYLYDGTTKIFSRDFPKNYYISGFLSGLFYRRNCFRCGYTDINRTGDITLGDFWGLGKESPSELSATHGVSLVMANTPKGEEAIRAIAGKLRMEDRQLSEAVAGNSQLRHPFTRPERYEDFQKALVADGYEAACRKYLDKYISEHTRYMQIEEHPILMFPYRIYIKIRAKLKKG